MAEKRQRESTGFLIKQRAFLKLYIITNIENGRWYGLQLLDELKKEFKPLGFEPQHSEIYRALHELEDEEQILTKIKVKPDGAKRKEVVVYKIKDMEKAKAYKKLVKADLERCEQLLQKALRDNFS
ncbi:MULTISPECIES: helix-turn-helix transcriptional regulator [Heyndrickxia]|uniref:helix-turn-helix transcriptional regulator n=1 Tax=Heyndrickxia TaxID=2837504 RepID=UPI001A9447FD|nr:helix-turn-helix transcriptional regulator [Heyndrickxia coagulans]MED4346355.1 helix-turn-helix transcriptional regulator [Heyndrickxia coagulans]MED4406178.1 helix-turn-helix transcriptional regulator [Heyndrickxia coagulans]MED4967159.1 helix-turn-helix transcriptional regulator [Heyndrickxia coagulans]QWU07753.1 helix-turn-helix transcriptional regulator [Heyndrickxia coagulans]